MNLQPFSIEAYDRILIAAPHPDDETLGNGGVMQRAIQAGKQVKVVLATNGDGYTKAVMKDFKRYFPKKEDYVKLGNMRQEEIAEGIGVFGVSKDNLIYLSYPDFGLLEMWTDHWSRSNPYRSIYTKATHSPYKRIYNPEAVFCGEDLLGDLQKVIGDYRPDLILVTHSYDTHPDHRALKYFINLAVATMGLKDSAYEPTVLEYLIHREKFPAPTEYLPEADLLPPSDLTRLGISWMKIDLTSDEVAKKKASLQEYRTQMHVLAWLMDAFIRKNELFSTVPETTLPVLAEGEPKDPYTWRGPDGSYIKPVDRSPEKDMVFNEKLAGTDLVAIYAARQADVGLAVAAELRSRPRKRLNYILGVRTLNADGEVGFAEARSKKPDDTGNQVEFHGRFAHFLFPANQIGDPVMVFVGAEVEGPKELSLDDTNWPRLIVK
jgi:LmbE family N-acetylglucosaminyl deacetylase